MNKADGKSTAGPKKDNRGKIAKKSRDHLSPIQNYQVYLLPNNTGRVSMTSRHGLLGKDRSVLRRSNLTGTRFLRKNNAKGKKYLLTIEVDG